ncbi:MULTISPECIES: sugar ABC transporter substrate-binding protein [unclassified Clostridium]|uniref:ABC transporter substrate-binding protein n=1 Tax=unclassified Clostridium TaxID=2614128 RepID=UPI0011063AE6|nr:MULTISPECIES: sugar ABC transporter substrate-binding protein [unclassified Clostridium]
MQKRGITRIVCTALCAALAFALPGCGPAEQQTASTPPSETQSAANEPVTLEFWDMAWGPAEKYPVVAEEIIAKYKEAAPHVTIKYTNLPWSNWFETYSTAVASNGAPDVATGGGYMPFQFAPKGESADLQWILDEWEKEGALGDFPEGFVEYFTWQGRQVGIPYNFSPRCIFIRKDWLEEKGLQEPKTWDEFIQMCKAFTDKEKGIYGFAFGVTNNAGGSFTQWAINNGGFTYDKEGNAALNSESNLETMRFFNRMKQEGILPEGIENYTGDDAQKLFGAGRLGAIYGASDWIVNSTTGDVSRDQVLVLHPLESPSGLQKNCIFINGYMMFEQSDQKDEGMKFLKWWSENNADLWEKGGMGSFPTRQSFLDTLEVLKTPVVKQPFTEYIIPDSVQTVYPMQNGTPSAAVVEGQGYDKQLIQSALTQDEAQWKELLNKLNDELAGLIAEMDQ